MATELQVSNLFLMASGGRRQDKLQRTSSLSEVEEGKKNPRKMLHSLGSREDSSPKFLSHSSDPGVWTVSTSQLRSNHTTDRQTHLLRNNTVPQQDHCDSSGSKKHPLLRRHSTTTGRRRHVKDTSCQTELDVFGIGTGLWYLDRRDSKVVNGTEWKVENGSTDQIVAKNIHSLEVSGTEASCSPKIKPRRSHSIVSGRTRLSTDTAFSETSLVESVDSSGDGGSCFSADIESDSDFVTDDEETWENPKQPLLGRRKIKTKHSSHKDPKSWCANEGTESVNGNICEGQSSIQHQQNSLDSNENNETHQQSRRTRHSPEEFQLENIQKCSEEESSTIESTSNESEFASPSTSSEDSSSSCPCERSTNEGDTEGEECPQCLQETDTVDERALSPEVVVVNDEVDDQDEIERTIREGIAPEPLSPAYLKPPPTIDIIGDIMHKGKPIPDDLEVGVNTGGCRRLSEEEFVATLNIHDAARSGDLHVVKLLLKRDPKRMETVDERGWTPIHLAAANGHSDVVKFLALEGAHLAALDPSGYNALHIAAMNGHYECLEVLLRMGVDVDSVTTDGFTSLHLATMNNFVDCCRTLLRWGANLAKEDALGRNIPDMIEEYSLDEVQMFIEGFQHDLERLRADDENR